MAIICKDNVFTLKTKNSAYQMKEDKGFLFHTYYGPSVGDTDMSYLGRTSGISGLWNRRLQRLLSPGSLS